VCDRIPLRASARTGREQVPDPAAEVGTAENCIRDERGSEKGRYKIFSSHFDPRSAM
jgi:hypothetical protein